MKQAGLLEYIPKKSAALSVSGELLERIRIKNPELHNIMVELTNLRHISMDHLHFGIFKKLFQGQEVELDAFCTEILAFINTLTLNSRLRRQTAYNLEQIKKNILLLQTQPKEPINIPSIIINENDFIQFEQHSCGLRWYLGELSSSL